MLIVFVHGNIIIVMIIIYILAVVGHYAIITMQVLLRIFQCISLMASRAYIDYVLYVK
jgi:uncharacterized membrane protein